jgi:hypothetical protein
LQQGLGEAKGIPQENYSKHDGRREEFGIPQAKKGFRIHAYKHLHPSPEMGGGEKRAVPMKGSKCYQLGCEAVKRLRPHFGTLVLKLG